MPCSALAESWTSLPCSRRVYQLTLISASSATSSRRRPGVSRRFDRLGSPTSWGCSAPRRMRRNAPNLSRCSMLGMAHPLPRPRWICKAIIVSPRRRMLSRHRALRARVTRWLAFSSGWGDWAEGQPFPFFEADDRKQNYRLTMAAKSLHGSTMHASRTGQPAQPSPAGDRAGGERVELAPRPASAATARRSARVFAATHRLGDDLADTLCLVASELVTNAVLHARTTLVLTLELHPGV